MVLSNLLYKSLTNMKRREFLTNTGVTSLGLLALARCSSNWKERSRLKPPLKLIKDQNEYLDLPEGFKYKIISKSGNKMSDGFYVPGRPDGMGAFRSDENDCILIRNHENSAGPLIDSPFGPSNELFQEINPSLLYDAGYGKNPGLGGTTTLIYDEKNQVLLKEYLSLAGTYRNCAGGPTPWNSWITCEEDVTNADEGVVEKDHGFVFDVAVSAVGPIAPKPIKAMGRFNHEAIAVDPKTRIIYQTEDRSDGLIYRFIPSNPEDLHQGGKLQALAIPELPTADTRNWEKRGVRVGQKLSVSWVDLEDVLSPLDDLRYRGAESGAAIFARGEGMWYSEGAVYFTCTNGGPNSFGQVFKYNIEEEKLELFAESEDKTVLHMCDNLTITPWGDALLCEDNSEVNRLHLIDQEGNIRLFGINRSSESEFAGAVFSPSGKTLFVNIQENGETVAITGPWDDLKS